MLTKQEILLGKGPGGKQEGKGPQENSSATGSQSWVLW